ncbi:MAG: (2Fe-2S)-binding protein [Deltaproteobacteria bacterium]|nr:(2Fe-2S)-binding protein [Deltaproteobacteria bacterium]
MTEDVKRACPCYDVSGQAFRDLARRGITDAKKIQTMTGAGLGCGMCEDRMFMVIRDAIQEARNGGPEEKGNARK